VFRVLAVVFCPSLSGSARAWGQELGRREGQNTFPVTRLEAEINRRKLLRVYTTGGGVELMRPRVSALGIGYEEARALGPGSVTTAFPRPIPPSIIERIEVREGHTVLGLAAGANVGIILAAAGSGSANSDLSYNVLFVPLGAGVGFVVGGSIVHWKTVYERRDSAGTLTPRKS
jgi:hypothetical protein